MIVFPLIMLIGHSPTNQLLVSQVVVLSTHGLDDSYTCQLTETFDANFGENVCLYTPNAIFTNSLSAS